MQHLALLSLFVISAVRSQTINENKATYQSLSWPGVQSLLNFGAVQGYYTISQMETILDSYLTNFPEIFAQIVIIGKTVNNQDILAIQMTATSGNRELSQNDPRVLDIASFSNKYSSRPAILFTGMHDGGDPITMKMCMYIMKRLIYNYVHDDADTIYLLQTRQLWFIPMINKDRYLTAINGGILSSVPSRNLKPLSQGCQGVSLRYNYPLHNGDTSSPNSFQCSSDYYGTGQLFTEPETKAVMNLVNRVSFGIVLNYFSINNAVLLPLTYSATNDFENDNNYNRTGDYSIYKQIFDNSQLNSGTYFGTTFKRNGQTFLGEISDYLYAQKGIYSISVELGKYGFPTINNQITVVQTIDIMDYFYPMVLYSLFKIRENFEWEILYQNPENCYERHKAFVSCNDYNNTRVFSAKYVLHNDGLMDSAQLQITIQKTANINIKAVSVQMTYSELYAFRDTELVLTPISTLGTSQSFNIPTIKRQSYRIITVYGTMEGSAEPLSLTFQVNGYKSYQGRQDLITDTRAIGNVDGFHRTVVDVVVDFEPRRPSIILMTIYFVMMGMGLFGLFLYFIFKRLTRCCRKRQ